MIDGSKTQSVLAKCPTRAWGWSRPYKLIWIIVLAMKDSHILKLNLFSSLLWQTGWSRDYLWQTIDNWNPSLLPCSSRPSRHALNSVTLSRCDVTCDNVMFVMCLSHVKMRRRSRDIGEWRVRDTFQHRLHERGRRTSASDDDVVPLFRNGHGVIRRWTRDSLWDSQRLYGYYFIKAGPRTLAGWAHRMVKLRRTLLWLQTSLPWNC